MADLEVFSKWMFKELIMFNKLPILPVISFLFESWLHTVTRSGYKEKS